MTLNANEALRLAGSKARSAYILFVVMGFVAVATSLGLAFLDASSTAMPEAVNYKATMRAQYLAGSGVNLAEHYVMYPPMTVAYGSYWTGANSINTDGTTDYCNVAVLRSDGWTPARTDPNLYRLTVTGVATDPDGSVRAKKTVTSEVMAPLTQKWQFPYTYLSTGALNVASVSRITGDIHSNSSLSGLGWCNGKLSAVSACTWLGTGPPISLTSLAAAFTPVPTSNVANYSSYTILGRTYTAYTGFSSNTMLSTDATALNAIDMSATNPGRIIIAPAGDFRVRANVNLNGTLVVNGRCQFDDSAAHTITAMQYFPALVSTGDILMSANSMVVNLVGPVICAGKLDNNSRSGTVLNVTGPWIVASNAIGVRSDNQYNFSYSAQRAVFWDFQNAIAPQPITVLSWKEN